MCERTCGGCWGPTHVLEAATVAGWRVDGRRGGGVAGPVPDEMGWKGFFPQGFP